MNEVGKVLAFKKGGGDKFMRAPVYVNIFSNLDKFKNWGIFLLRVGIGLMFIYHGYPKIVGGAEVWVKLGTAMRFFGITYAPEFFGLMSALTEFGGGILLVFGLSVRPVAALLAFDMLVAVAMHLGLGQGFAKATEAIEMGIVFLSLVLIGPGKYSIDSLIGDKFRHK